MHSEFSGRNRFVDFISTSVNEGYYMKMFWNFPESIVEVNAVVRHFRHSWVLIRNIWQEMYENLKILENLAIVCTKQKQRQKDASFRNGYMS